MARHSFRHRMPAVAPGALRHARSLQHKTKTPYRVVYEQVTEKKKTLIKEVAFSQKAPRGYTFIPAGDPQITNRCKEIAREDGEKVFIVTTSKPRAKPNRKDRAQSTHLAHEVHRVGYHFPSLVVEKACMSLGISLSQSGQVVFKGNFPARDIGRQTSYASGRNSNGHGLQDKPVETEESQAALDAQARETIKDLFPKIPDKDLQNIVRQAFKKNTNRVGTAVELPLPRRVQLAVVAHIRHVYTNYDRLLRIVSYPEARARVEKPCLDLLAQWRSDDDDDADAMEDILREVIVIDDDDDDQDDNVDVSSRINRNDREASVELISSSTFATRAATHAVDHSTFEQILQPSQQGSLILDGRGFDLNARDRLPPFTQYLPDDHTRPDRNGIYHDRWKEALHRRRMHQEPVLTIQQDSMVEDGPDHRGYSQPRDDPRLQMLALNRKHSYTDQTTGAIDRRPRERSDNPGQVDLPAQHQATFAFDSRPVTYMVSDRETEVNRAYADYNQRINPSIVPASETRRLMRQPSNQRESRKDAHDPRVYYLPHQVERVLPSVEGAFRNANHREEFYDESNEFNKPELVRMERQNPRLLSVCDKMGVLHRQNYRSGDKILLPTENTWETSRDFYEGSIRQGSYTNTGSVSHHDYAASMHPPGHVVKRSLLLGPAEARGYPGLLRPAQDSAFSIDGTRQASQERLDRQFYSAYNEQFQAPYGQSSLLGQRHVLRKPAYIAVESSRSIPAFHYSQKQLPVLYGSSSPYDSAHKDRAEHRFEPLDSSQISALRPSDGRILEASQGIQHRFTDLTISPEHSTHYAKDVYGAFEGSRQAYPPSRIDGPRMHTSKRPQTSIFLRKVGDDRYSKPKPERLRPSESESGLPHEHLRRIQRRDPEVFHDVSNGRNNRIPIMETHRRDNIGWVKDEYRQMTTPYDQPGLANPYHSAECYRRRDAPHTSTNLEKIRSYPEEIIILD